MKKILISILILSYASFVFAQTGLVNNANIMVDDNAYIKIQGANANYVNNSNGKIKLDGTLQLNGNWSNQASTSNIWLGSSQGSVEFVGTTTQNIYDNTHFRSLHINNPSGVLLNNTLEVDNLFIDNGGVLDAGVAGNHDIIVFGNWDSKSGVFTPHDNHVYFVGDDDQTLETAPAQNFYDFTLNNNNKLYFLNALNITNFYVTSGVGEAVVNANIDAMLVYNGDAPQTTGDEWPAVTAFNVYIDNTSAGGVTLAGDKQISPGKTITVNGRLNLESHVISGDGDFTAQSGASLSTAHPDGFDGNLTTSGNINISDASHFIFEGSVAQETGLLLPDVITNLTVNNTAGDVMLTHTGHTTVTGDYMAMNGRLVVRPAAELTVNGQLILADGVGLILKSDPTGTASFIDNGFISGLGTATAENYLRHEPLPNDFGRYLSVPIANAHTDMLAHAANDSIYFYNTTQMPPGWELITNDFMDVMTGYVTRYNDIAHTINYTGDLNTGPQVNSNLVRTSENYGWNLVGNPYPSAIDFSDPNVILHNLNPTIYFRPVDGGPCHTYNRETGVGVPGSITAPAIIPPMQSFWMQVPIGETSGSLTLSNATRVHETQATPYQKNNIPMIRLRADNTLFTDEMAVVFIDQASAAFDETYDALHMEAQNINYPELFSFSTDSFELSINALNFDYTHIIVPLGYKANNFGTHLIEAFDFYDIAPNIDIYLEDKEEAVMHNLRQNQFYTFNHTDSSHLNRFDLHFMYTTVDTDDIFAESVSNGPSQIYAHSNTIYINFNGATEQKYKVHVYNMLGQLIHADQVFDIGQLHQINMNTARGHYVVHVYNETFNKTQKVSLVR